MEFEFGNLLSAYVLSQSSATDLRFSMIYGYMYDLMNSYNAQRVCTLESPSSVHNL